MIENLKPRTLNNVVVAEVVPYERTSHWGVQLF